MYIRCPKCGRRGHLPDRWAPGARSLRCRRCHANFPMPELAGVAAERQAGSAFGPAAARSRSPEPAEFLVDGFLGGFDASAGMPRRLGPSDSNYELTFTLHDAGGDSGAESDWDAQTDEIRPEAPSSDEIEALVPAATPTGGPEPWQHRFIETWGPVLIGVVLGLLAVAIPSIGYLSWRALGGGPAPGLHAPTLIAGFAGVVALLMIALPLILLAASVTELARDVRRLRDHLERRAGRTQ